MMGYLFWVDRNSVKSQDIFFICNIFCGAIDKNVTRVFLTIFRLELVFGF